MRVLSLLTLTYLAVLVLALAASLIAILFYLGRIGATLAEVRSALARVGEKTRLLEPGLQRLRDSVSAGVNPLEEAQSRLARVEERLAALAEQTRAAPGGR